MGLFNKFMKGNYRIWVKCPNCGAGTEVKIPKGISVVDFVEGGKCKCVSCFVTFYPSEYTTEHFEKEKKKELVLARDIQVKPKPNLNKKDKIFKSKFNKSKRNYDKDYNITGQIF